MRIVGGKYRHRNIIYPDDATHTRPTKDRVREAIFSALGDISDMKVLDLYAGSGAMGIEALSRGAKHATFVDISPIAIKVIKDNLTNLKVDPNEYEVIKNKDINAINYLKEKGSCFDLIILDPPYEEGQYEEIVDLLNSMTTPTNIPAPPTEDGSYNLACTVTDGEVVYSWVSVE